MNLIIAGGRDCLFTADDFASLDWINRFAEVTEVVSGGATGAARCGEHWAALNKIPVCVFHPEWEKHGKKAGPIRNKKMAEYAHAVALFPGGKGTDSMHAESVKAGIKIYDYRLSRS